MVCTAILRALVMARIAVALAVFYLYARKFNARNAVLRGLR